MPRNRCDAADLKRPLNESSLTDGRQRLRGTNVQLHPSARGLTMRPALSLQQEETMTSHRLLGMLCASSFV
ncbi:MAG: hypothetical protein ACHP83_11260, partial [Burkholderiales bacterium]